MSKRDKLRAKLREAFLERVKEGLVSWPEIYARYLVFKTTPYLKKEHLSAKVIVAYWAVTQILTEEDRERLNAK